MANCMLELKLLTEQWQDDILAKTFRCSEKMYNTLVRHAIICLEELRADSYYLRLLNEYRQCPDTDDYKKQKSKTSKKLTKRVRYYGLSEHAFQAYIVKMKNESYQNMLDIDTAQKLATRVWKAVEKVLYSDGKKVHFKKYGELCSLESKKNTSGIKFNKNTMRVNFKNLSLPVKIRKNDTYALEMLTHKICYCRIVRKPFKSGYKYFLQLVLDGIPPVDYQLGEGNVGLDMGTSTIAAIGENDGLFVAHGNNMGKENNQTVAKYNKLIISLTRKLERQRRLNNPNNYNEDGTIRKGSKKWVRTKGYYKTLFALKDAYRRKTEFLLQLHNKTAKKVIPLGDRFITEPMNWKVLQKRSKKPTEKSDKTITVTNKAAKTRTVRKNKKKKGFGKSLNNHSPGTLEVIINRKLAYFNKKLEYVNLPTYRASQYNPETDTYEKCTLDVRLKPMFDKLIQRDLLSAFLLANPLSDLENIDIATVQAKTTQFIAIHDKIINALKDIPNLPKCMGL